MALFGSKSGTHTLSAFHFHRMSEKPKYACIEMGGTTVSVAIADELGDFLWKQRGIPSASPCNTTEVIDNICNALKGSGHEFKGIGIASFGPLSIKDGSIANSPKESWRHFPLVAEIQKRFPGIPIVLDTDVNAPAYSEYLGIKKYDPNVSSVTYLTVGTGIGGGVYSDGRSYHGHMHPEYGHIYCKRHPKDTYEGGCPFHKDCLEGLANANSLAQRLNIKESELPNVPNDHEIWDIFTFYIGQAAATACLAYSCEYFVVGGGIMTGEGRDFLFEKANKYCAELINGYVEPPKIVKPVYNRDAGLVGAFALISQQDAFKVK